MKKLFFTVAFLSGLSVMSYAQQNNQQSPMRIYRMETGTNQGQNTQLTKEQEIQQCKDLLHALDVKEAYLKSNPEELKIATEAGWFEDAAATRARLQARIKELENN